MAAVGELVQSTTGQWMAGPPFTGLADPAGVAVDTAGNVYVADFHKRRVLKLAAGQRIAKPPHQREFHTPRWLGRTPPLGSPWDARPNRQPGNGSFPAQLDDQPQTPTTHVSAPPN